MKLNTANQIVFAVLCLAVTIWAFHNPPPKVYTVSNSTEQWQQVINNLEQAKGIMLRSTYPGNEIAASMDSLSKFEQQIQREVSAQMQAEMKKDSTNSVKPKTK